MTPVGLAAACLALAAAAGPPGPAAAGAPAATRSVEELADAQLREREAVAVARERRLSSYAERLEARLGAALADAHRLDERERALAAREQELDAREQRVTGAGAATVEQRRLEALEAALATEERQLAGQERSFAPALDAAARREREAVAREAAELRGAASPPPSALPSPVERRRATVGDDERELAVLDERLVAMGDRLEALERQLRARGERLDAHRRRLEARTERVALLERRASLAPPAAAPAPPRPPPGGAPPGAGDDRAAVAVVVRSPVALVRGRGPVAAPARAGSAPHPALAAGDRAVAAATVVTYAGPAASPSELDLEGVDRIARLAARDRCELLIWARARDAAQLPEAQRRASELRTRVLAAGPLDGRRVVIRLTTRPGAMPVDVVVSALRADAAAPAVAPAAAAAHLEPGEAGRRQLREAVQGAQGSIEACVGDHLAARKLRRADGVLTLTVNGAGRVTRVESSGDLGGTEVEECLGRSAAGWALPGGDGGYVAEVPVAVFRGGSPGAHR